MIRPTIFAALLLGAATLSAQAAPAFCPPPNPLSPPISVGDTDVIGGDSHCDFDTIQAAIDSLGTCPATIALTHEVPYVNQHIAIADKSVTLVGLADGLSCPSGPIANGAVRQVAANPTEPVLLLSGGSLGGRVLTITGTSHVTLKYLQIADGRAAAANGGGIGFTGSGSLRLDTSQVYYNAGGNGGGIAVDATLGHVELTVGANTAIFGNNAQTNGGGIYMNGDVHLSMTADRSSIHDNHALGHGGGVYVIGGRADIGSPGIPDCGDPACPYEAAIDSNTAHEGAGIYVRNSNSNDTVAVVFTTDPARPTTLDHNVATGYGGALYADGSNGNPQNTRATICLFDTRITNNSARRDAIANAEFKDAGIYINADPEGLCGKASLPAKGAVDCAGAPGCNEFSGNFVTDSAAGSLFGIGLSRLVANRFALVRNDAAYGFDLYPADSDSMHITNCLVANNQFAVGAMFLGAGDTFVDGCTFGGNILSGNRFFDMGPDTESPATLHLTRSIVYGDDNDLTALFSDTGAGALLADYNILRDLTTVTSGVRNISNDPQFKDPTNGDFHVYLIFSPAIDYAPANEGRDLDGHTRSIDLIDSFHTNIYGPRDLGAYEIQQSCAVDDTVFCDGFEG